MSTYKSRIAWCFIALAVLVIVAQIMLEGYAPNFDIWKTLGLAPSTCPRVVFISAICFFIAATLQFPFREEEGWECKCGYDLSYLNKDSRRCPECGEKVLLEWASQPGHLSHATTNRLRWTIVLFVISAGMFAFGIVAWIL